MFKMVRKTPAKTLGEEESMFVGVGPLAVGVVAERSGAQVSGVVLEVGEFAYLLLS